MWQRCEGMLRILFPKEYQTWAVIGIVFGFTLSLISNVFLALLIVFCLGNLIRLSVL